MKRITFFAIMLLAFCNISFSKIAPNYFRVAVVQLPSSYTGNFVKMDSFARVAKIQGASLVIFPEESVFGWLNPIVFSRALPIPGEFSDRFAQIAKRNRIWVATGIAERGPRIDPTYSNAFDSGLLIDPNGNIVLHNRQHNVVKKAFDWCPPTYDSGCNYTPGPLSDIRVAETPFGRTAILVCADAYTYDTSVLKRLKTYNPQLVIINWGVTAALISECGGDGFNATQYATAAAKFLGTAYVIGANAIGDRPYGRFRPSCYCGYSGFATPSGDVGGVTDAIQQLVVFNIPYPSKLKKAGSKQNAVKAKSSHLKSKSQPVH